MEKNINTFNLNTGEHGQFRIEVAKGNQGRFFYVKPLENLVYEIMDDQGPIGSIQLDRNDHLHCRNIGCALDMPLLHSIREGIQFHEQWSPRA